MRWRALQQFAHLLHELVDPRDADRGVHEGIAGPVAAEAAAVRDRADGVARRVRCGRGNAEP